MASDALAQILVRKGAYDEAESEALRSLKISEQLNGKENVDYISAHVTLAEVYGSKGEYKLAETTSRAALNSAVEMLGMEHLTTSRAYLILGQILDTDNRMDDAEIFFLRAISCLLYTSPSPRD